MVPLGAGITSITLAGGAYVQPSASVMVTPYTSSRPTVICSVFSPVDQAQATPPEGAVRIISSPSQIGGGCDNPIVPVKLFASMVTTLDMVAEQP